MIQTSYTKGDENEINHKKRKNDGTNHAWDFSGPRGNSSIGYVHGNEEKKRILPGSQQKSIKFSPHDLPILSKQQLSAPVV